VTVTPELRVRVSDRIQEQYFNGKTYYSLHDKQLAVIPKLDSQRPDPRHFPILEDQHAPVLPSTPTHGNHPSPDQLPQVRHAYRCE
jgi:hypothetical protein